MTSDRVIKVVAAVCFILIAVALVAAWDSPATGYESSIYRATPVLVWVLLGFSIVCGVGMIIHQLYTKQHEASQLWMVGLLLLVVSYTAVLSLHIIRGYAFWCFHDPATHLGEIKNIIGTGSIAGGNYYPLATIFAAQLSETCNVDPLVFHKALPLVFALIYVAFIYLLAKSVLPNKGAVILVTVASLAPLHDSYLNFTPNHLANLLLPMALFLFVKSFDPQAWQWRAMIILMAFVFPVFHPLATVALAVVFVTVPLAKAIFDRIAKKVRPVFDSSVKVGVVTLAVLLVWGAGWLSSFPLAGGVVHSLIAEDYSITTDPATIEPDPITIEPSPTLERRPEPYTLETAPQLERAGGKITTLARLIDAIAYAEGYGYSAVQYIFNIYGAVFLYMLLALIGLPILWRKTRYQPNFNNLASLYGPLAGIALVIAALFFTAVFFGPMRLVIYVVLLSTVFAGFILYETLERGRASHKSIWLRIMASLLVAITLVVCFGNGVSKVYASPHILEDNWQVTRTEIMGMDWLFDKKDQSLSMRAHTLTPFRFAEFLLTREERAQRPDFPPGYGTSPPLHFGYDKETWLGECYTEDIYMPLGDRDRLRYVEVFPQLAKYRYYPEDFERLEGDPTVDKLYSNGGLHVYYIRGIVADCCFSVCPNN